MLPRRFDQARPFITLGLLVLAWLLIPTAVKRFTRLSFFELQAPLETVDVVTDLPGVRPIDESIVRNVAETAAVTLMRRTAHWRPADVDAATCRRHGVAVAGLDEEGAGIGQIGRADGVTRSDHTFMVTARGGGAYPG